VKLRSWLWVAAFGAGVVVALNANDIRRYLKLRTM
jgi:hypothetical protein